MTPHPPRPSPDEGESFQAPEPDLIPPATGPPGVAATLITIIRSCAETLADSDDRARWIDECHHELAALLEELPMQADPSMTAGEVSEFLDHMAEGQPGLAEGIKRGIAESEAGSPFGTAMDYHAPPGDGALVRRRPKRDNPAS